MGRGQTDQEQTGRTQQIQTGHDQKDVQEIKEPDLELGEKSLDSPTPSSTEDLILAPILRRRGKRVRMTASEEDFFPAPDDQDDLYAETDDPSLRTGVDGQRRGERRGMLTRLGQMLDLLHSCSIVTRYALYTLPVAAALAIPIVLTDTIYREARIGHLRLLGLFIFLEVVWAALWVCKLLALAAPLVVQAICGFFVPGIRRWSLMLMALEVPLSLLAWVCVAYGATPLLCVFDQTYCSSESWLKTLRTVFKASIVVASVFFAEKALVQLVSIEYHRRQYASRIRSSKRDVAVLDTLLRASRRLIPDFSGRGEFRDLDTIIQGNALADLRRSLGKMAPVPPIAKPVTAVTGKIATKIIEDIGRVRHKMTAALGAMASDISGRNLLNTSSSKAIVIGALENDRTSKALAKRIWLSFVKEGKKVLEKDDLIQVLSGEECKYHRDLDSSKELGPENIQGDTTDGAYRVRGYHLREHAEKIFEVLDGDENGDISLDEMTMFVVRVATERRNRMASMHDISQAIAVLDRLLSLVVLAGIAFIYAAFFSPTFASKTASLWTSVAGLAFASGGIVTEFFACCVFIFIKHPYDVGDRVDIASGPPATTATNSTGDSSSVAMSPSPGTTELVVTRISLTYSIFRRVDSEKTVQIPHSMAASMWIENISRSRSMKERFVLFVSASTSTEDILTLRKELEAFVGSPEMKRDFLPGVEIELRSVGDMKALELRVEIMHKSNFANEQLRNKRRNGFMVELLDAVRRIPIHPPGGPTGPPLGDATNPSWSVSISPDECASVVREKKMTTTSVSDARIRINLGGNAADLEREASPKSQVSHIRTAEVTLESESLNSGSDDDVEKSNVPTGKRKVDMDWTRDRLKRFSLSTRQQARRAGSLRQTFVEHSS
ncbi:Hypothetical protein R9X50_00102100 [Acrodontium crateriforme]|uniref:EF-hand domain-containing protein n=1 Tax=Acrodontium crateriforme TaxID=150365 RepID=A0AAQ3LYD4_9PEZI|nr:Hypothetical protein R9X50_00102100 [Acrodontium crateriforme]